VVIVHREDPLLRGQVRSYYGWTEETGVVTRRREGPGGSVVLVLSFGNEWRIGDTYDESRAPGRFTSFVAGLHRSAVLTEHDGWSAGIQVNLAPPAAYALLRTPLHELADVTVPLDAVLGADFERLVARVAELRDWPARFELVERALARRLAEEQPAPDIAWAWRRLAETHGRARVGSLAEELGWSRKRLVQRFREQVGLPPKTVARLLRFEHATDLLEREPRPGFAELAFLCGYYDQSHLINEFQAIAGTTPTAYVAPALEP
jgi:AraC-like DNA-binding protein